MYGIYFFGILGVATIFVSGMLWKQNEKVVAILAAIVALFILNGCTSVTRSYAITEGKCIVSEGVYANGVCFKEFEVIL